MQFTDPVNTGSLVNLFLGLILVLVIFIVIAYIFKKLSGAGTMSSGHMKLMDTMHLSTREKVVLIRVADTCIVLGLSPSGMTPLHILDGELPGPHPSSSADIKSRFSDMLTSARMKTE